MANTAAATDYPYPTIWIPVMPDEKCETPKRPWPADKRPPTLDDPRVSRLFAKGGELEGKKRFAYLLRGFDRDGNIDYFLPGDEFPLPRSKHHEAMYTLALFHSLGWPDKTSRDMLSDGVYHSLLIATELDEAQHYDPEHYFNTLPGKESYQSPRDARVSSAYLERGYFVMRVRACDYLPAQNTWVDVALDVAYTRTRQAIDKLVEIRDAIINGPEQLLYPRILVWPDNDRRALARATFRADKVEAELLAKGVRFDRAAWKQAQRLTNQALRRGVQRRCGAPGTIELTTALEQVQMAGLSMPYEGPAEDEYARYWSSLLDGYDMREKLEARSAQFLREMRDKGIPAPEAYQ